jgi:hydroxyacylglutathione hydrolase
MPYEIITFAHMGVNCYLVKTEGGFAMVDAGFALAQGGLKKILAEAGCKPGDLKIVVLTHGDWDHTGNCLFLRKKYGAKIAIHQSEEAALESGDIYASRRRKGNVPKLVFGLFRPAMVRTFKADIFIADGQDLSPFGFNARVIHTPGHTIGSVSILTVFGDFFCGDFLTNSDGPRTNSFLDDAAEMAASLEKIKGLDIKRVYPGHGKPFKPDDLFTANQK